MTARKRGLRRQRRFRLRQGTEHRRRRPGQKVVVESDTKKMLKIVSFVYLIPVILFLAGYLIMLACNTSVAVQYTAAVAGAVLGILLAIWYDRRVKARGGLSFTIVRVF